MNTESKNQDNKQDGNYQPSDLDVKSQIFIFMAIPPDGGFAWIILIISFICISVVDGMIMSVGTLFPQAVHDTDITTFQASVCMAVQSAMYFFAGPLICALANTYGLRIPAVLGGFVAAAGLFLAAFAYKFAEMFITYGLITGIGFGMIYSPTILIVPVYFNKYRIIATGITLAGTGFGTTSVAFLNEYMFYDIHWRYIMLGQSVVCVFLAFLTMLYRPVEPQQIGVIPQSNPTSIERYESSLRTSSSIEINSITITVFTSNLQIMGESSRPATASAPIRTYKSEEFDIMKWCRIKFLNKFARCCVKQRKTSVTIKSDDDIATVSLDKNNESKDEKYLVETRPLFRSDVFLIKTPSVEKQSSHSLETMETTITSAQQSIEVGILTEQQRRTVMDILPQCDYESPKKFSKFQKLLMILLRISPITMRGLQLLLDMSIFNYRSFRLFLLATFFLSLGIKTTYWYVTQRALVYKINYDHAWWILPITGISNIIFRITAATLYYFYRFEPALTITGTLLICGLFNFVSGFVGQSNIIFTALLAVVHGGGTSFFYSLRGVMAVKYFTIDNLRASYGHHMMITGAGQLFGQMISGVLLQISSGYDIPFIYGGACIIISSCIFWLVPVANNRDNIR